VPVPPLADKVAEYGDPTVPAARDVVVTCNCEGLTVMESGFVAVTPELSLTWTVKLLAPAVVGVPEIVFPLILNPAGSVPLLTDQE